MVASGPNSKVREELVPLAFEASAGTSSIAALSVTDAVAQDLLPPSGRDLKLLQDHLDGGGRLPGFEIAGTRVAATVYLRQEARIGRNVLARLPADGAAGGSVVIRGPRRSSRGGAVPTRWLGETRDPSSTTVWTTMRRV